ncbi:MFS transporter [Demetria terragena]|uniref:MFS transporter n=1 Tax=Demetria terragena TaxID=63959 RepID=UPI0003769C5C|nr:MFS transporter [Demetria terragena]
MSALANTATPDAVRRAKYAVFAAFVSSGGLFATWASRIPESIRELDVSTSRFGVLLLFMSIGALAAMPLLGWIVAQVGVVRAIAGAAVVGAAGIILAGIGVSVLAEQWVVGLGLMVGGLGVGTWDAAMNLAGAEVEQQLGTTVMPHFHAAFSGGTVVSALIGAGASAAGVSIALHLTVMSALMALAVLVTVRPIGSVTQHSAPTSEAPQPKKTARSAWGERRTLLIGVVTMVAAFTEGTANDWIAEAFVSGHDVPVWAGTLAFAMFLSFMTAGRLIGTSLLDRYGRVPVLRIAFGGAVVGSLMVVFGTTAIAYAGVAVWGVGVSLGFPVGMSAAADDPERAPARVAVVSTIGYTAFLAGPPLLGFLGDHYGILRALLVVGAAVLLALVCLPAVREPERNELR